MRPKRLALRLSLMILSSLMVMVMGTILLASCQPTVENQVEVLPEVACPVPAILPEEGTTVMAKNAVYNTMIPPMDASAPAKTATATFALG